MQKQPTGPGAGPEVTWSITAGKAGWWAVPAVQGRMLVGGSAIPSFLSWPLGTMFVLLLHSPLPKK